MREARQRLGMTQRELASATGLSTQYISDIERGLATGTTETVARICRALGLSMDEIFLAAGYENTEQAGRPGEVGRGAGGAVAGDGAAHEGGA